MLRSRRDLVARSVRTLLQGGSAGGAEGSARGLVTSTQRSLKAGESDVGATDAPSAPHATLNGAGQHRSVWGGPGPGSAVSAVHEVHKPGSKRAAWQHHEVEALRDAGKQYELARYAGPARWGKVKEDTRFKAALDGRTSSACSQKWTTLFGRVDKAAVSRVDDEPLPPQDTGKVQQLAEVLAGILGSDEGKKAKRKAHATAVEKPPSPLTDAAPEVHATKGVMRNVTVMYRGEIVPRGFAVARATSAPPPARTFVGAGLAPAAAPAAAAAAARGSGVQEGALKGEDRTFGGAELLPEDPPVASVFPYQSASTFLPPETWQLLRAHVLKRAGECEICGSHKAQNVHERFQYNEELRSATLTRFLSLCNACYSASRPRLHQASTPNGANMVATMMRARGLSFTGAKGVFKAAQSLHKQRSKGARWDVDLSILEANSLPCYATVLMPAGAAATAGAAASTQQRRLSAQR